MLEITALALKEFNTFFKDKEKQNIRIFLVSGGCNGPRLTMAFERPQKNETFIKKDDYTFCVNTDLVTEIEALKIDIEQENRAFLIEPKRPYTNAGACAARCGGCGIILRSIVPFSKIFKSEALC